MPNVKTVIEAVKAFVKPATTKFPAKPPDHLPPGFKGKIALDKEKCMGCGACLQSCPSFAYRHEVKDQKKLLWYNPGSCIFCEQCTKVCPTEALKMSQTWDMSAPITVDLWEQYNELEMQLCKGCQRPYATIKHLDWIGKKLSEAKIDDSRRRTIILNEYKIAREYCEDCRKLKEDELALHKIKLY